MEVPRHMRLDWFDGGFDIYWPSKADVECLSKAHDSFFGMQKTKSISNNRDEEKPKEVAASLKPQEVWQSPQVDGDR